MNYIIIFSAKYLVIFSLLLFVYYFFKSDRETRKKILQTGGLSLPFTYILGVIARSIYFNPRPFVVESIEPLISHVADNGFPSDHTLLLAALASLVFIFDKKWSIPFWVITLLVGLSRVYAQVHHLFDIIGSIIIAIVATAIAYVIIRQSWNKNNQINSSSLPL